MKTYYSDTKLSFSVYTTTGRARVWFDAICGEGYLYSSASKSICEAIEASPFFHSGKVKLIRGGEEEKTREAANQEAAIIDVPGISRATEAVSFLESKGHLGYLRSKEEIRKKALEMGYRFVDLK